jgi:thiamine-phosphate pyrophosphorylase
MARSHTLVNRRRGKIRRKNSAVSWKTLFECNLTSSTARDFLFLPQSASKSGQQYGEIRVPNSATLYLDLAVNGEASETLGAVLAAALDAAPVASLLIRPSTATDEKTLKALIALAQNRGIAALLPADVAGAAKLGADGVHVLWAPDVVQQFKSIRGGAGSGMIVGADAGRTRHDAMELGEGGADYVAFGVPAHVEDRARAAERQLGLVSWWSEVFEIPCVALNVSDTEQARRLAEAGADFVGVTISGNETASDAAMRVRAYSEAVSAPEDAK